MSATAVVALSETKLIFLQSLRDLLPSTKVLSDKQLERKIGIEKLSEASLEVDAWLSSSVNNELTLNERRALYSQTFKCLRAYIKEDLKIPFTLNTFINNIYLLSYAVDLAFPGYADAKLLKHAIIPKRSP